MTRLSSAEKMQALRAKWKAAGFRFLTLAVHPDDVERLRRYAARLLAKRPGKP